MTRLLPFLLVPIVELLLLFELGAAIGFWPVFLWCLVTFVVGLALMRRQAQAAHGFMTSLVGAPGQRPEAARGIDSEALSDSALLAVAGAVLAFPGLVTDVVGLALLVPAVRRSASRSIWRRVAPQAPTFQTRSEGAHAARPPSAATARQAAKAQTTARAPLASDVEILAPGLVASPFRTRPVVIDSDDRKRR